MIIGAEVVCGEDRGAMRQGCGHRIVDDNDIFVMRIQKDDLKIENKVLLLSIVTQITSPMIYITNPTNLSSRHAMIIQAVVVCGEGR